MIGKLSGTVTDIAEEYIIVDVGGVGYKVHPPATDFALFSTDKEMTLWTHTAVREDALDLYGFQTQNDLTFFEHLIGVSGIGPKSALGILSIAPTETITGAIAAGDTSYLTKVSGIGKKTADKIVLELQDKLGGLASEQATADRKVESDVLEALKGLGYTAGEAREVLGQIDNDISGTDQKIKAALKLLGGR